MPTRIEPQVELNVVSDRYMLLHRGNILGQAHHVAAAADDDLMTVEDVRLMNARRTPTSLAARAPELTRRFSFRPIDRSFSSLLHAFPYHITSFANE